MPIYEFRCKECGEQFQDLFPTSNVDFGSVVCVKCHGQSVEKVLSVFASDVKKVAEPVTAPCGAHCACHSA